MSFSKSYCAANFLLTKKPLRNYFVFLPAFFSPIYSLLFILLNYCVAGFVYHFIDWGVTLFRTVVGIGD